MPFERLEEKAVRRIVVVITALAVMSAIGLDRARASQTTSGRITFVSQDVVEVGGKRLLVTPESHLMSQGRSISIGSLQRGMQVAEAEFDDAGQIIELDVNGVVE